MNAYNVVFPTQLEKKIRKIASIRNKIVHEVNFNQIPDRNGFIRTANEIDAKLQAIAIDVISKNIQIRSVAATQHQNRNGYQPIAESQAFTRQQPNIVVVQPPIIIQRDTPQLPHDDNCPIICMVISAFISLFCPCAGCIVICVYAITGENMQQGARRRKAFMLLCLAIIIGAIFWFIYIIYSNDE
eukprot:454656_1